MCKCVLSGDTVVLAGAPKPGQTAPPELVLGLSNLLAPRIARHSEQTDEAFGWQSRELLRTLTIGRQLKFRIDPSGSDKAGPSARQQATVWVCTAPGVAGPDSVNKQVAAAGLARVVDVGAARGDEYDAIAAAGRAAQAAGRGSHARDQAAGTRTSIWTLTPEQAHAMAVELGADGKPVLAVVESVLGGSTLRVRVATAGPHIFATFQMAGVQCPRAGPMGTALPKAGAPAAQPPAAAPAAGEPHGAEARAFTDSRLLHRDVTLFIGGADKTGAFVGRVEHPAGDIAAELLKLGLARIVDWSSSFTSPAHIGSLRAAERGAKLAKLRVWATYEPSAAKLPSSAREYMGRVLQIDSGDSLVVLTNPTRPAGIAADERRVSLASLRAPRLGNPRRDEKDAPWAFEAKEWLRKALVGRDVHVSVDYTRASVPGEGAVAGGSLPNRIFGTVTIYRKGEAVPAANIGCGLLEAGLAEVQKHRADEDRSRDYDKLLEAEAAARTAKRGLHSGKEAPLHRNADLCSDPAKAKAQFPFLKRAGAGLRGVVEHVFAGGRVKLFVPQESTYVMFGVAGVRCPATAKAAGAAGPARGAEPMGPEALQWMREACMQLEVEVEAEEVDKNGTVLGPLYIGKGGARRNVGAELLRKGLGKGVWPVIERVRDSAELIAAEEEARTAKRGLWAFEPEEEPEDGTTATGPRKGDAFSALNLDKGDEPRTIAPSAAVSPPIACTLADITDGRCFTLQAEADRECIDGVNAALDALYKEHGTQHGPLHDVRKGKVVAALFDEGNGTRQWYRGRVEGKHRPVPGDARVPPSEVGMERWDVTYIDYGNAAVLTILSMRDVEPTVSSPPPLARRGGLAYLCVPGIKAEHGEEAAAALANAAFGRPLLAVSHGIDTCAPESDADAAGGAPPRLALALLDAESGACVNGALVEAGLARVSRTEARRLRRRLGLSLPPRAAVPTASFYAAEVAAAASAGLAEHPDLVYLRAMENAQEVARKSRAGMWHYGVGGDADASEWGGGGPRGGGAWGAKR